MKKKSTASTLPKKLQKALELFPSIVAANKRNYEKREKFVEETFGELARKVYREVHGKEPKRR